MPRSVWESKIEPFLVEIAGMVRDGMTDEQIAKSLGVAYSTFRKYIKAKPELAKIVIQTKDYVDRIAEESLFKLVKGFEYEEVTKERAENCETGKAEMVVTKVVTKQVAPNVQAAMNWLCNRKPDAWRHRQEVAISGIEEEQSKFAELIKQREQNDESRT